MFHRYTLSKFKYTLWAIGNKQLLYNCQIKIMELLLRLLVLLIKTVDGKIFINKMTIFLI